MFVSKLPPKLDFDMLAAAAPVSADRRTFVLALMGNLGRMAEVNAALLAVIEPASAPSVRKWRDLRPTPDRQTASEHSVSA